MVSACTEDAIPSRLFGLVRPTAKGAGSMASFAIMCFVLIFSDAICISILVLGHCCSGSDTTGDNIPPYMYRAVAAVGKLLVIGVSLSA